MTTDYEYYLKGDPDDVRLALIEVTHPSFLYAYRLVQNHAYGVKVCHEDGNWYEYAYSPITIKKSKSDDDLDQSITIGIGDLGEYLPDDIDRLRDCSQYAHIKPTLNYREYLLSNLERPILTVLGLEVSDWQPNKEGSVFVCKAKELNLTRIGLAYTLDKFPLLRGVFVIASWQDMHTLQYTDTYHCEHFVIDVYRFLLGIDVSGYFLSGQFATTYTLKNFSKLDTPRQYCFVLCRDKNKAHIGIWYNNQVLHLGHRGVVLQPLFVLQQQFERMGFYALKANDEQYNLAVLD